MNVITALYFGFFALTGQIVLLRELSVLFSGQEVFLSLGLAAWLFWAAAGSRCFYSFTKSRFYEKSEKVFLFANIWIIFGFACLGALILARISKTFVPFGVMPGAEQIFLFSFGIFLMPAFLAGFLFNFIASLFFDKTKSWVYLPYFLEASGAAAAGFVYTFLIAGSLANFECLLYGILGLIFIAWVLYRPVAKNRIKFPFMFYAYIGAYLLISANAVRISEHLKEKPWKAYEVVLSKESKYSHLMLLKKNGVYSIVSNGFITASFPDADSYEPRVHWAMLFHPNPKKIFTSGGGLAGTFDELLKYEPESLDYAETDDVLLDIHSALVQPKKFGIKINFIREDMRRFLAKSADKYDVVILNNPPPLNLEYNRFYTKEFYALAAKALAAEGVLAFTLPAHENFIGADMARELATVFNALKMSFGSIRVIAGDELTVLASNNNKFLLQDALENYSRAGIQNKFLTPEFMKLKYTDASRNALIENILKNSSKRPNSDLEPVTYRHSLSVWLGKFLSPAGAVAAVILALFGILALKSFKRDIRIFVFAASFAGISAEMILIFAFQSFVGYMHGYIGSLFAVFMAGLASGAVCFKFAENYPREKTAGLLRVCMASYAAFFASAALLLKFAGAGIFTIFGLMFINGFFAGLFYVLNGFYMEHSADLSESVGKLYSSDLLGSFLGLTVFSFALVNFTGYPQILLLNALLIAGLSYFGSKRTGR